ncbi:hypothetical protein QTG56_24890 (plasmid) [Rossellomorea sp. AcN35-11]|nr:hypothetical protein [Rossellomorea aquimaris]WJV31873.1 hypothetical protein QTG56_24890 [Rossellomorea sp. AcN35-11]
MKLEYRLDDEINEYPALWHYKDIPLSELISRMTCEYLVRDGKTYEVTMTTKEPNNVTVIYVKEEDFQNNPNEHHYGYIGFEFKEVINKDEYKLVQSRDIESHSEASHILHCDTMYLGEHLGEFKVDSREIDEDRKCYVYYGTFDN